MTQNESLLCQTKICETAENMFEMGADSVLRNATCCPTCISLGEASKAVWPVQATLPNMLRFNMLKLLILLRLCSLTTETSSTSQVSSLDQLQTTAVRTISCSASYWNLGEYGLGYEYE